MSKYNKTELFKKALVREQLTTDQGLFLYETAKTSELVFVANQIKKNILKENYNIVGWIIDRNVNITNICFSQCKFCNFYRKPGDPEGYVTSIEEYKQKIEEMFAHGGDQLLLQGGMNPKLGLDFYKNLFSTLKKLYPNLKLHTLGPPEIVHIAKKSKKTYTQVLIELRNAGMDSLPGAGAEILSDRVRKIISKAKCSSEEWLEVMRQAHKLNIPTSATMMFGHIETMRERIEHLVKLRSVQNEKPTYSEGFITFVPWPFMPENTELSEMYDNLPLISGEDYIRLIAISRIMLTNIKNIQASWLTVGKEVAQISLHAGANDFGSIMIEENVVSAAGANYKFDAQGIQNAIKEAGFIPVRRNQKYEYFQK